MSTIPMTDAEERLRWERRARELLQELALGLASAADEGAALSLTIEAVCRHTRWPLGHAWVVGEGGDLVSTKLWHQDDEARFAEFRRVTEACSFGPGIGLPGRVLASARPAWITDVAKDPNFPRRAVYQASDVGGGFAFPVRVDQRISAVLEFFADVAVPPDEALLEVMDAIGVLVGQVIERKRAEIELAASELRFGSVMRSAKDAIIATDMHGRIAFWNAGAERLFGWTEAEMTGQDLDRIVPLSYRDAHRAGMERMRRTGEGRVIGKVVELSGLRKDGAEVPIELSLGSWEAGGHRYFSAVVRDISERKAAEAERKRAAEALAAKNDALERSHAELLRSYQQAERIFAAYSEILPGTDLEGRYRLEQRIGSGGYGVVYRAVQIGLDRAVAVKLFRPASGRITPEHLRRFRVEGISACRVNHPNAVSVIDSGVSADGLPYIVMELLEGATLGEAILALGRVPPRRAVAILRDICAGLAAAHAEGIVHRDVKPDNVYLHRGRDGEVVKILDFGIAKLMSDTGEVPVEALTGTGHMIGTPTYMSPERLQGAPYDGRADVYSVGVMLYELLTGRPPFGVTGSTPWETVRAHLTVHPAPLRELDPALPEQLEGLALATLSKKPDERPTAAELAEKLDALLPLVPEHFSTEAVPGAPRAADTMKTLD
jgi:PAS domain S-box-containing protein